MRAGDTRHKDILQNLEADPCVDDRVAALFFEELAKQDTPSDPEDALGQAFEVVRDNSETLTCQGRKVPDGQFTTLFRLDPPSLLRYRTPDILDRFGITDNRLEGGLTDDDLRSVVDEYDGQVSLRNQLSIVWATRYEAASSLLGDISSLADRLGIEPTFLVTRYIICVYERADTATSLHVPRVLDAIDNERFLPNPDCSADHGMTRPVNDPENKGLPEAVHRECTLVPTVWEMSTT